MNIGLVGIGFVGGALKKSFELKGQKVLAYDKFKAIGNIESILNTDIVFLCLPTPYVDGHGFNIAALQEVLGFLSNPGDAYKRYQGLVVVKSTVEPGTTKILSETYRLNICHNPEFLTARTAFEDFDNQKHIVIGQHRLLAAQDSRGICTPYKSPEILSDIYKELYPDAEISICSSEESEAMKLFCNNFYAIKVQVFNEFYLLCQRIGADYSAVKSMMLKNGWINPMHTTIGLDGQLSYGGACFPKDTNALNHFMKRMGTPNAIVDACISERNKMRKD
jgi:UDPglucose 6-dehydrogenase